ncbi:MAG: hypothetical protein ACLQNE_11600 [Thermoguttaceae bacterium]
MVRRLANLTLRWGLAGILGVTSLFGSSLHDILGIPAGQQVESACERREVSLQDAPPIAARHVTSCHDEANCPICNYLAQGRIVGERYEGILVTVNAPNRSPAIPFFLPSPHLQPFQARAPPAA